MLQSGRYAVSDYKSAFERNPYRDSLAILVLKTNLGEAGSHSSTFGSLLLYFNVTASGRNNTQDQNLDRVSSLSGDRMACSFDCEEHSTEKIPPKPPPLPLLPDLITNRFLSPRLF